MSELVCPLDFRYGREEMKAVFSEESKLSLLLAVEAALARAHAKVGNIPREDADEITRKATTGYVKVERVKEIESEIRHDLMAVVKALSEQCTESAARWVHLGATSYDIIDTANALQLQTASQIIMGELRKLNLSVAALARKHKNTIMLGRTHGQHAVPITFGLKMAVFAAETGRQMDRLEEGEKRLAAGKMAGAVGSGAALGQKALEIQDIVMTELGLAAEDASTQIVGRDRYIEFLSNLANIATSVEKFGTEIRNLQRNEILEAAESFNVKKQVGSSTMAHKKNPVNCEQVCGMARLVRAQLLPAWENAIQWHERDLCNSSAERFILPHACIITDWIIHQMANVFENLAVYPDRMKENLERSLGLPMAESVMMKLTEKGMGRQDAHELVRKCSMIAATDRINLAEVLKGDAGVMVVMGAAEIDAAMNPENYAGSSAEIVERVISKLEKRKQL